MGSVLPALYIITNLLSLINIPLLAFKQMISSTLHWFHPLRVAWQILHMIWNTISKYPDTVEPNNEVPRD